MTGTLLILTMSDRVEATLMSSMSDRVGETLMSSMSDRVVNVNHE